MNAMEGHQAHVYYPHVKHRHVIAPCPLHATAANPSKRRLGKCSVCLLGLVSRVPCTVRKTNSMVLLHGIAIVPSIPFAATERRTTHVLAAVAALEALSTSAVPLSPSLRRDTAVLDVENSAAPMGKTKVQPLASMRSNSSSMFPSSPLQAGTPSWTPA